MSNSSSSNSSPSHSPSLSPSSTDPKDYLTPPPPALSAQSLFVNSITLPKPQNPNPCPSSYDSGSKRVKLSNPPVAVTDENPPPPPPPPQAGDRPDQPIASPEAEPNQARRKGRPKGSKNKRKQPNVAPPEPEPKPEPSIKFHILQVPPGSDVLEGIRHFARTQNAGVCVVGGMGRVKEVMVRSMMGMHPKPHGFVHHGIYDLVSIHGVYRGHAKVKNEVKTSGNGGNLWPKQALRSFIPLTVLLAGPYSSVIGGMATDKLIAASNVLLHVTTFKDVELHKMGPSGGPPPSTIGPKPGPDQCPSPGPSNSEPGPRVDGLNLDLSLKYHKRANSM